MTDPGRITGWDLQLPQASLSLRVGGLHAPMVVVRGPNRSGKTLLATFMAEALGGQPGTGASWLGFAGSGARGTVTWEDAGGEVVVALRPADGTPGLATIAGGAVDGDRAQALEASWRDAFAPGVGRGLVDANALDWAGAIGAAAANGQVRGPHHRDQRWQARQLAMQLEATMGSLFAPTWTGSPAHRLLGEARRAIELAGGGPTAPAANAAERARLAGEVERHTADLQRMTAELDRFDSVPSSADLDDVVTALDELDRLLTGDGGASNGHPGTTARAEDDRNGSDPGPWSAISSAVASDRAASEAAARLAAVCRP